ncbi:MAG TPA: RHS repeat-associated core domain-containing protein, partial [Anaerolineae bacterium]|nr:RHS repeat-associated core domain-containing protein [Anaerolineae bacterium]
VEEYVDNSGWELDAVYIHGLGVDNVLTITRDGETYYYHKDGLGSVTELTDATGTLVQAYEYDAWGIPTIYVPDSAIKNTYTFTGREWDASLGLYYYRARHYDPSLGRFLQTDPAGYGDSMNLYVYVSGLPTMLIDPTGMEDWDTDWENGHERAKWITENAGAPWDTDVEKIDIGEVKDGMVYLREEYGGGVISLRKARKIVGEHMYMGALAGTSTIQNRIREAFAGNGIEKECHMLSAVGEGALQGWHEGAVVIADHATLGLVPSWHQESLEVQADARRNGDVLSQVGFGLGKAGVEGVQFWAGTGAWKALGTTAKGVTTFARNSRHVARAVQALSRVPGLARAGRAALTGARALRAAGPLAGKALAVGVTAHSGFEAGRAIAAGDYNAAVHNVGRIGLTIGWTHALTEPQGRSASVETGGNTVYQSVNKAGQVDYVGITGNFEQRAAAHLRLDALRIRPIQGLEALSRADARAVEQVLIEWHGLGRNGGTLLNKINSIATSNPIYESAIARGHEILRTIGCPGF